MIRSYYSIFLPETSFLHYLYIQFPERFVTTATTTITKTITMTTTTITKDRETIKTVTKTTMENTFGESEDTWNIPEDQGENECTNKRRRRRRKRNE